MQHHVLEFAFAEPVPAAGGYVSATTAAELCDAPSEEQLEGAPDGQLARTELLTAVALIRCQRTHRLGECPRGLDARLGNPCFGHPDRLPALVR